jgi:hypothetical protein
MKRYKFSRRKYVFPGDEAIQVAKFLAMKRYNRFRNLFFEAMQRYNIFALAEEALQGTGVLYLTKSLDRTGPPMSVW